ncbi:MAG: PatB family C-S lyase [Chloroflexi bacterium]|nr:PatB family C-S lyase [Chloroflexota bacterium]
MQYDFDQPIERRNTSSAKWNSFDPDVLPMWIADMDFRAPEAVLQALYQQVEHGVFGYPRGLYDGPQESPLIRRAIIERLAGRYGWQVTPEDLVILPGVVHGFRIACWALAAPEGGVLVQTPVYEPILKAAKTMGAVSQEMELTRGPDGVYRVDQAAFEAALTAQTRLFILCNPHNPVGRVFRPDELERMAEACLRREVVICSDEIHGDLLFEGCRHTPIAALHPEIAQNTITLMAPTKTFNLAGLQFAFAVIQNPSLRRRFVKGVHTFIGWVNMMGQAAALAAYQHGDEWLAQVLTYLQGNRDFLEGFVREQLPGISLATPQGTYMAWLDCRQAGIEGSPRDFFLKQAQVAFNEGASFGKGGEGFVRLNFACRRAVLSEALERMRTSLAASQNSLPEDPARQRPASSRPGS